MMVLKKYFGIFFCVLFMFAVLLGKDAIQIDRLADASIFEQVVNNIYLKGSPVSNVFANSQFYIDNQYYKNSAQELIGLSITPPIYEERNMMGFHAYYVLYLLAPLKIFFTASLITNLFFVMSFFALLLIAYMCVRRQAVSIIYPVSIVILIFSNPNWFMGLMGQFYPDRLFLGFGMLLCYLLQRRKFDVLFLLTLAITCSINERAALISGMLIIGYQIVFLNELSKRHALVGIFIGITAIAYFKIQQKFFLDNFYYSNFIPTTLDGIKQNIAYKGYLAGMVKNVENNSFLLVLALCNFRWFLLACMVLAPNFLGNIGGAEKTGWMTHYHSYYFPVLCFAAVMGLENVMTLIKTRFPNFQTYLTFCLIFLTLSAYFSQERFYLSGASIKPISGTREYVRSFKRVLKGEHTGYIIREQANALVQKNSTISASEMVIGLLHESAYVAYFPLGVGLTDYVFVNCSELTGESGKFSYKALIDMKYYPLRDHTLNVFSSTDLCLFEKKK